MCQILQLNMGPASSLAGLPFSLRLVCFQKYEKISFTFPCLELVIMIVVAQHEIYLLCTLSAEIV